MFIDSETTRDALRQEGHVLIKRLRLCKSHHTLPSCRRAAVIPRRVYKHGPPDGGRGRFVPGRLEFNFSAVSSHLICSARRSKAILYYLCELPQFGFI